MNNATNSRKYKTTHGWLSFDFNLKNAPYSLWINLGEAKSKCEHIAGVPLRPSIANYLHQVYLAKGVLATTAIEGNTLTEEEVRKHLDGKLKLPPSKEYLKQEIDNVVQACNEIGTKIISGGNPDLTLNTVKSFNKMVLNNLALEKGVFAGEIRTYSVGVGNYLGAPAEDCEFLLQKLCEWLSGPDFESPPETQIIYALVKSVVAHIYLAWIHPFGDGNGRTARLMEFQILLSAGVPSPVAHLLSNHYNQTRQEYYRQLDHASKSGGDILPFIAYATQGFVDGLREQIGVIREQQWDITWRNYIHETFRDKTTASANRQKRLALDLGEIGQSVPLNKITELTPKLAKLYATKTLRTVQRDASELESLNLIERNENGIRAKLEIILAFLPPAAKPVKKTDQIPLL